MCFGASAPSKYDDVCVSVYYEFAVAGALGVVGGSGTAAVSGG